MKKHANLRIVLVISLALLLTGCGGGGATPTPTPDPSQTHEPAKPAAPTTFKVTITNSSDYIFNELYISPSASDQWGGDQLGSTSILKRGGSYDVTLDKYDFDNFDIRVVDEDDDEYVFTYVTLIDRTSVEISFNDGLCALVRTAAGEETIVYGELYSSSSYDDDDYETSDSYYFDFTIYNESDYEIYAIYIMPAYTDGEGIDILPSALEPGGSYDLFEEVHPDYVGITEWTIRIVDVDGDESAYYDVFNPWQVSYIDVLWDGTIPGYYCEFH